MAITINNAVNRGANGSLPFSYTPADVADAVLVVIAHRVNGTVSGIAAGGAALTEAAHVQSSTPNQCAAGIYVLPNPGTAPLVIDGTAGGWAMCTLGGVDTANPVRASAGASGGSANNNLPVEAVIAAEAGNLVLSVFTNRDTDDGVTGAPTGSQTELYYDDQYQHQASAGFEDVAASGDIIHGWTQNSGNRSALAMVEFAAASTGPASGISAPAYGGGFAAADPIVRAASGARTASLDVSGTYTGTPGAIECRVFDTDSGAAVPGFDWQTLDAAPASGAFSGTLQNLPAGGGKALAGTYRVDVRFASDPAVTASGHTFGIGVGLVLGGQSNMRNWDDVDGAAPQTLAALARHVSGSNDEGYAAIAGDGHIALANLIAATSGMPVFFKNTAVGGTSITVWEPGGSNYWQLRNPVQNMDPVAVLWNQGESDSAQTAEWYEAKLEGLAAGLRTDSRADLPFINIPLLYQANNPAGKANIRRGQYQFLDASAHNHAAAHMPELYGDLADGTHLTPAGYVKMAGRAADAVAAIVLGAGNQYKGPEITGISEVSATETDVALSHNGGADIAPASGIDGFEISDDDFSSVEAISAAVRQDAATIRLTHGAVSGVRKLRYLHSNDVEPADPALDDGGYAVEPAYEALEASAAAPAPPDGLTATATGATSALLSWNDGSDNEDRFVLQYAADALFTAPVTLTAAAQATSRSVGELAAETTYYFRVRAENAAGASPWSAAAQIAMPAAGTNPPAARAGRIRSVRAEPRAQGIEAG